MKAFIIGFLIFVLVFLLNIFVMAQVNVQNNGTLYIASSGNIVYINGALVNASGAALTNNGNLYIKQNLTNNQASMAVGTGTLYLNGTATQTVAGTQIFKTYNLVTDNTNGFTFNNDLSASGTHTFVNGNITTASSPNFMVYEAGASYSGDGDSKHVIGWVKKIGSTDFIFPVGNTTYERTIALTNLTATSEFNVKHNNGITPFRTSLFPPIVLVDTNEYWTISKISGASANVVMNWDNTKIPIPQVMLSAIRAGYYDGSFWINDGGTGTGAVAGIGSVTSSSISAFNNMFTIASTAVVLPMNIISFTGNRNGNYNQLKWVIANEQDQLHYELQRSDDATNFTTINIQKTKNSSGTSSYNYDDVAAVQSKVYYRLRCVDNSGKIKYSNIILIATATDSKAFYVIKNPVQDRIDIYATDAVAGNYNYALTNANGQTVQLGKLEIKSSGNYTIKLQQQLAPGMYILVVRNAQNVLQKNILKE